jgi:hypothetical protein
MRTRMFLATLVALFAALVPALVTSPANAASLSTWKRLARCESGLRWHLNTHNGYYGGLQFSSGTWRAFGGRKYARNAHRASRNQQIRIAERVRRAQGWGAWPACSRRIGLR